ncbi:ComF family protein [Deinococcus peraridilitoris]|uniref:ComF family protein n=1 Tax=Deinococcus peraridilitoris TaxID=432329 RepID=UPI001FDFD5E4|nr:phosphoribosyltransferase family protein [Deinococcus peraridilitoris]
MSAHSVLSRQAHPHLVSLGRYEGPLRRAVQALKYEGSREVARAIARELAGAVPESWHPEVVCAVPLHERRLRSRGYNQAALLAGALAHGLCVPHRELLSRERFTLQQARLSASERRANVEGAFRTVGAVPSRVLLVDDVLTTGTTLAECARMLRCAGADQVYFAVAAR